ncbi:ABC transporter I family member 17 isoform X2 [Benincasa hispida]|uniref:ABC transporter I family member 17 isoform X2 n=1 Tax=Benincasa hispida TaxID=102211 RepID=UPI00190113DB|nr:ABC transporter I family member 17 isoform X2 [Benincasa hispida]
MIPDTLTPADTSDGIRDQLREHLLVVNEEIENGGVDGHVKIRIRNLTNSILRGISVDIPKGKIVGIIGPSGGGKSTTLRALNRLWEPPADTVFLDGHDIVNLDVLSLRRKVGMLFQIPVLFEGTVADNIRYGPQLMGKMLSDDEVHKLLSLADLDSSFFSKIGSELSVGQAQRVALARTLANAPEEVHLEREQLLEQILTKLDHSSHCSFLFMLAITIPYEMLVLLDLSKRKNFKKT